MLLCLPALGLIGVYGGGAPLLVWATGSVLPLLVVLAVTALRWPVLVALPVSALLLALVGPSLIALRPAAPTGAALALLGRGLIAGWREMLTVTVPIGTAGALLVPPLACGAIGGTAALLLARTRWYPAALLPVLAVGVVAGLLGRPAAPAGLVPLLAAADLVLGLGWVAWRRGAGTPAVNVGRARWRRPAVAGLSLLVAAGAAVAVTAADPGDRLALRSRLAVPVDPATVPNPLSQFRHLSVDLADQPLLSVRGLAAGDRLRVAALDDYDGHVFTVAGRDGPFGRIGSRRDPAATGPVKDAEVAVQGWREAYLPTVGDLETIEFTGPNATTLTEAFRYGGPGLTGLLPGGPASGDGWRQRGIGEAVPADAVPAGDRIAAVPAPATPPVPDALRAAAQKWTTGVSSPAEQLTALVKTLREQGYYSQGRSGQPPSPPGHGLNRLVDMVSGAAMVGDAEQYSALLVVLARSLGIPARVVVGFDVPPSGELTGAQLTAWVEVPYAASGWVSYDPTPDTDRTDAQTEPPAQAGRHLPDNQPPPAAIGADSAQVQSGDSVQRPDRGQDDRRRSAADSAVPLWVWLLIGLGALLLLLVLAVATILLLKKLRTRRRQRQPDPGARAKAAWRELLDVAADAGMVFTPDKTRAQVSAQLGAIGVSASEVAGIADLADFSPTLLSPVAADRQWDLVSRARSEVLARLTRTQRLRAGLSTKSMRSPGRRVRDNPGREAAATPSPDARER